MNLDDFRCMRRGKQLATLLPQDCKWLSGYNHHSQPRKRALLLLHGFSSSPAVFRTLFPHLTRYDAVVAPTLPGHGDNLDTFATTTATDWLTAVEQHCQTLCQEYAAVDVLGLSLGGILACHLSQRFALNHLYLLAPALDLRISTTVALPLAKLLQTLGFNRLRANAGNLYLNNNCEIAYRQLPLSTIIEVLSFIKQFQFSLPLCPTDVFLGKHDEVVHSERIADRFLLANQTKIHWLANSAHVLPLDGDIECIIDCLNRT